MDDAHEFAHEFTHEQPASIASFIVRFVIESAHEPAADDPNGSVVPNGSLPLATGYRLPATDSPHLWRAEIQHIQSHEKIHFSDRDGLARLLEFIAHYVPIDPR